MRQETPSPSSLATRIASAPRRHDNDYPLWQGPCADGELGGITQSMLVRFMSCRERFRLKYVLGLEPPDKWVKTIGFGNMWHECEENHAAGYGHEHALSLHVDRQIKQYPLQRDEILKWGCVCAVQFPEYVNFWATHPDVVGRTPLLQEQVFDVSYVLPSGRTVRLRGKWDSVDLIDGGVWLQENKTKGDVDKAQIERQLKFDLQTLLYLTAMVESQTAEKEPSLCRASIRGVRYNVVRRPLSGGVGNIKPHAAKSTKTKYTPGETDAEFYERLRRDYIADDPAYWFFRVRAEISTKDVQVFRETCLDPLLEQVCWWYYEVTNRLGVHTPNYYPPMNYRTPFGVWSALEEGGATEYDAFLSSGSESGLRRVETMFGELQ